MKRSEIRGGPPEPALRFASCVLRACFSSILRGGARMKIIGLPKAINETQIQFRQLCELGGGTKGGPVRSKVQKLLRESGKSLNDGLGYPIVQEHLKEFA